MTIAGCTPVQPTFGTVVFNAAEFVAIYPEFTTTATIALSGNFVNATTFLGNSCYSRVCDAPTRQTLLYLLTAHFTALFQGVNNSGPAGMVGRISQAAEGSVTVSAEYASEMSQSAAFFAQTQYGASFWLLTANLRAMQYVPAPQPNFSPFPLYGGPGWYPNGYYGGGYGGCGWGC